MQRRKKQSVAKWLLLCFPYGLFLMWRRSCRWHPVFKSIVTALFVCAACAIVAFPAPEQQRPAMVQLVENEPRASIFGPEAPAGYSAAGYLPASEETNIFADDVVDDNVYVYASSEEGSTYYHMPDCKYAYASAQRLTLYEAYKLGYTTPCQLCKPPVYTPHADDAQ